MRACICTDASDRLDARKGRGAFPFYYRAITTQRTKLSPYFLAETRYPEHPKTWGEHIRKRRLDRNMTQLEAAKEMGVTESSVWNWESGLHEPETERIPAIVSFLRFNPFPCPTSLPEQLLRLRTTKGWTQAQFAARLGVDPATLARLPLLEGGKNASC